MFSDINSWRVIDECPGTGLDLIEPVSRRAACLIARNKTNSLLTTDFFRFQGVVEMMKGLDYHHNNFMTIIAHMVMVPIPPDDQANHLQVDLLHEATAYLNRLGQFYYFLCSDFVKDGFPNAQTLAPTIDKFVIFRKKYSAHRSIDAPRNETANVRATHAMAMSSIGGKLFEPKPGQTPNFMTTGADVEDFFRKLWQNNYFQFQIITDDPNEFYNFSIEKEHPAIMQETYAVLKLVLGL